MEWELRGRGVVVGFDEAGRGPLAGPLAVALVHFAPEKLQSIYQGKILPGLTDSKKIKPKLREQLFAGIQKEALFYRIEFVSPRWIDTHNPNQATFFAIRKALNRLSIPNPYLVLDGSYRLETNLWKWIHPPYMSIPKADESILSVSAASVLAKVARDKLMVAYAKKYPHHHFERHMGYGTAIHRQAIQDHGLTPIHRRTFCKKWVGGL